MDKILAYLDQTATQNIKDLEEVSNFDFENATEEDLEKFQKSLKEKLKGLERTTKEMEQIKELLNVKK